MNTFQDQVNLQESRPNTFEDYFHHYSEKVLVIINEHAGPSTNVPECRKQISQCFQANNIEVIFIPIDKLHSITMATYQKQNIFAIIAAGGDGTVRAVASKVLATNLPLGIIPLGTYNHLAKDLGMSGSLQQAIEVIMTQHTRSIDVAQVGEHIFLNNSSIGLYARAVRQRTRLTRWIPKWLRMFFAFVVIFVKFPLYSIQYKDQLQTIVLKSPLIFISNNKYHLKLFSLRQREKLNSGKLYLYVCSCQHRTTLLRLAIYFLLFRISPEGYFKEGAVDECQLSFNTKQVDVAIDGEVLQLETPLQYTIHRQTLKVIVPKEQPK